MIFYPIWNHHNFCRLFCLFVCCLVIGDIITRFVNNLFFLVMVNQKSNYLVDWNLIKLFVNFLNFFWIIHKFFLNIFQNKFCFVFLLFCETEISNLNYFELYLNYFWIIFKSQIFNLAKSNRIIYFSPYLVIKSWFVSVK